MYDRILFPTDGSEGAAAALGHVLDVAAAHDATVHLLNVADTTRDSAVPVEGDVVDALHEEGKRIVGEAADRARERGVDVVTDVVEGEPYDAIVDYADARGIDLVVMPTRGRRGLERLLLGSTTERVVRRASAPVLTIPPDEGPVEYPYRNVLVPTDGSDAARHALAAGVDVADAAGADLHLLSVIDAASLGVDVRTDIQAASLEANAREVLDDAAAFAREAGVDPVAETTQYGPSIHRTILSYVDDHDVDLVVLGTHGRTGLDRYLLGSVAESLVRASPVPVVTIRAPDPEGGSDA